MLSGFGPGSLVAQTPVECHTHDAVHYDGKESVDTFDYVIVGAGSAGSVLANRLSADGETSICVLEAGGRDWHPFIHIPAGFIKTFYDGRFNWNYSMEPGAWTGASPRRVSRPAPPPPGRR